MGHKLLISDSLCPCFGCFVIVRIHLCHLHVWCSGGVCIFVHVSVYFRLMGLYFIVVALEASENMTIIFTISCVLVYCAITISAPPLQSHQLPILSVTTFAAWHRAVQAKLLFEN